MDMRVLDMLFSLGTYAVVLGGIIFVLKLMIGTANKQNWIEPKSHKIREPRLLWLFKLIAVSLLLHYLYFKHTCARTVRQQGD